MFNFYVCDDQQFSLKVIVDAVEKIIKKNEIVGCIRVATKNPNELLKKVENVESSVSDCNIYLLDIDMPEKCNGLELARRLRLLDSKGYIIFVTGHIEYEFMVYQNFLKVYSYMIKPIRSEELERTILAATSDYKRVYNHYSEKAARYLNFTSSYKSYCLNVEDIIYLEKSERKTLIHTKAGVFETKETLNHFVGLLEQYPEMIRVHKSFMVNKKMIEKIDYTMMEIKLFTGSMIPLSRANKKNVRQILTCK